MFLEHGALDRLFDILRDSGFDCVGPQARDGAIVFDHLDGAADLPWGLSDVQSPGSYRLIASDGQRCFAWANGPQALKPLVFAPRETLWTAAREENGVLHFSEPTNDMPPTAVFGVRACDLAALFIHDKHFLQGPHMDPAYRSRRQQLFLIAVNCTHPADTCFCASTGDGPRARYGFDLAMTELDNGFVIESHSESGQQVLDRLDLSPATTAQQKEAMHAVELAAEAQTRSLPSHNLQGPLFANLDHARWDDVAERCLACGNCTAVCPTCFCHQEHDEPLLDGTSSSHVREWDTCFSSAHGYIHGLPLRKDTREQYRQWLTHKLGSWHEQYGRSGCVGCGRCISWCPAGIDLTEEVAAIVGEVSP